MKLKRLLITLLAAAMGLSVLLAGCGPTTTDGKKTVESIKISATKTTYAVGDVINYADFKLTVTYTDKSTKTDLDLTSEGVTHNDVKTSAPGEFDLTATYEKKSDTIKITVAKAAEETGIISSFLLPESYELVQKEDDPAGTQSENRDSFMKAISYEVGDDNGFIFEPQAVDLDFDTNVKTPITNVKTEFELFVKGENGYPAAAETSPETYVTKKADANNPHDNNTYYFTEAAVGKTFKLVVTPSEDYVIVMDGDPSVEIEFTVVDGYNVYDQLGLSVFDNLNVKHWEKIKTEAGTLPWDLKPFVEYNDVKAVVLHANINIDPDDLPDYYFWDKDRTEVNQGYAAAAAIFTDPANTEAEEEHHYGEKLNGSLRDWAPERHSNAQHNFDNPAEGDQQEEYTPSVINMQKGIYCSTGSNISGNGMTISYTLEGENHKLYSVLEAAGVYKEAPKSHWSIFKYESKHVFGDIMDDDEAKYPLLNDGAPVVKNLRIVGQMPRLADTSGDPAQLMAFNTRVTSFKAINVNISKLFVAATADEDKATSGSGEAVPEDGTSTDFVDCKFFDMYSNMLYSWRSAYTVTNCIMKEAGGPIFILVDGDRKKASVPAENPDEAGPSITVDAKSVLESLAEGTEPWYSIYGVNVMFNTIKGTLGTIARGLGREMIHKTSDTAGKEHELVNVIAALIPSPDLVTKSFNSPDDVPQACGFIKRTLENGTVERFGLHPSYPGINLPVGGQQVPVDTVLNNVLATVAPVFYSGQLLAAYVQGGLASYGFPGDYVGTVQATPQTGNLPFSNDLTTLKANWAAGATDWLMISTRASESNVNTPRFGVLFGSVEPVAAN